MDTLIGILEVDFHRSERVESSASDCARSLTATSTIALPDEFRSPRMFDRIVCDPDILTASRSSRELGSA